MNNWKKGPTDKAKQLLEEILNFLNECNEKNEYTIQEMLWSIAMANAILYSELEIKKAKFLSICEIAYTDFMKMKKKDGNNG